MTTLTRTRSRQFSLRFLAMAAALATGVAQAEDVSDSDRILCAIQSTTICVEADTCYEVAPSDLDVPQFLIIDRTRRPSPRRRMHRASARRRSMR